MLHLQIQLAGLLCCPPGRSVTPRVQCLGYHAKVQLSILTIDGAMGSGINLWACRGLTRCASCDRIQARPSQLSSQQLPSRRTLAACSSFACAELPCGLFEFFKQCFPLPQLWSALCSLRK